MIELIAALITGVATVIAALITKPNEQTVPSRATPGEPRPKTNGVWPHKVTRVAGLFVVGAIAGALLVRMVAAAAESGLNTGGFKVPVGTVVAFMGKVPPSGWLPCDGTEIDKAHGDLIRIVGNHTPDLQGVFLRGFDPKGKRDPEGPRRSEGHYQPDMLKRHTHKYTLATRETAGKSGANPPDVWAIHKKDNADPNEDGGEETRPKNVAINYVIKY